MSSENKWQFDIVRHIQSIIYPTGKVIRAPRVILSIGTHVVGPYRQDYSVLPLKRTDAVTVSGRMVKANKTMCWKILKRSIELVIVAQILPINSKPLKWLCYSYYKGGEDNYFCFSYQIYIFFHTKLKLLQGSCTLLIMAAPLDKS